MEIWRDIKNYEGLYSVSNYGNVKSVRKNALLKNNICGKGYACVCLCVNKDRVFYRIHRLVADAFLPNPTNLPQVNHKDENKTNNYVHINEDGSIDYEKSNLEWCTAKYNSNYGSKATGNKRCGARKTREIEQYGQNGQYIKTWSNAQSVEKELGFRHENILRACKGIYKQSNGYLWAFK